MADEKARLLGEVDRALRRKAKEVKDVEEVREALAASGSTGANVTPRGSAPGPLLEKGPGKRAREEDAMVVVEDSRQADHSQGGGGGEGARPLPLPPCQKPRAAAVAVSDDEEGGAAGERGHGDILSVLDVAGLALGTEPRTSTHRTTCTSHARVGVHQTRTICHVLYPLTLVTTLDFMNAASENN